jgi:pantoate--beta-alanine ligase
MKTARTIADLRTALHPLRAGERTVGLVPTMGAFHEGHLALIRAARDECDAVVVSVFVNPKQFGPGEDLHLYPRDEARDSALATEAGVDLLFAPDVDEIYPPGFQTWVEVEDLSHVLEGQYRPGHFRGVATVCLKLFSLVRPDRAYFGQKDAQQVAVVTRMVVDLALELEIRVVPTVRDDDGLALSSRNQLLAPEERQAATAISKALAAGADAHRDGRDAAAEASKALEHEPLVKPQYVQVARFDGRLVLAAAARVGAVRLIDNVILEGGQE